MRKQSREQPVQNAFQGSHLQTSYSDRTTKEAWDYPIRPFLDKEQHASQEESGQYNKAVTPQPYCVSQHDKAAERHHKESYEKE